MNQRMNNIGFHKTDGITREITIREQLIRNINFVGINDIKHPIHRIIDVDRKKLEDLLKFTEDELIAMSPEQFM
tara:strand:+ start:1698 stop:1919 length:222 start_codon:yes stop_codon:yes gene_type:complete